jgi:hypothetical protein
MTLPYELIKLCFDFLSDEDKEYFYETFKRETYYLYKRVKDINCGNFKVKKFKKLIYDDNINLDKINPAFTESIYFKVYRYDIEGLKLMRLDLSNFHRLKEITMSIDQNDIKNNVFKLSESIKFLKLGKGVYCQNLNNLINLEELECDDHKYNYDLLKKLKKLKLTRFCRDNFDISSLNLKHLNISFEKKITNLILPISLEKLILHKNSKIDITHLINLKELGIDVYDYIFSILLTKLSLIFNGKQNSCNLTHLINLNDVKISAFLNYGEKIILPNSVQNLEINCRCNLSDLQNLKKLTLNSDHGVLVSQKLCGLEELQLNNSITSCIDYIFPLSIKVLRNVYSKYIGDLINLEILELKNKFHDELNLTNLTKLKELITRECNYIKLPTHKINFIHYGYKYDSLKIISRITHYHYPFSEENLDLSNYISLKFFYHEHDMINIKYPKQIIIITKK